MKKGFTLVELLATITILGIIALLLVPTVTETLSSFRQDSSESQKKTIVSAAKLWASDHRIDLPSTEGDSVCVKVSELKQGYLEEDLKDPDTKQAISNDSGVQIKRVGKSYEYTYQDRCSGTIVSPSPTDNPNPTDSPDPTNSPDPTDSPIPSETPTPSEKPISIQLTLTEAGVTSSSITVKAAAKVTNDTLKGYQFSSNGGTWTSLQTSGTKIFTSLKRDTKYVIKVRAISSKNKQTEKSITVYTNNIGTPTYQVSNTSDHKKNVTIHYPSGKEASWVYEYSLNNGSSWKTVDGISTSIKFEQSGTVIARVRDTGNNNNTVTASVLTVTVEVPQLQVISSVNMISGSSNTNPCLTFENWKISWYYKYSDNSSIKPSNVTVEVFYPNATTPLTYKNQSAQLIIPTVPSPHNSTCAGDGKKYKIRVTDPNGKTGTVIYSWKQASSGKYEWSRDWYEY